MKSPERPAASKRAVELCAAALLFVFGAVVIYDSLRIGMRWAADGPEAGYFPFYVGVILCLSSAGIFLGASVRSGPGPAFVSMGALRLIMSVLVPTAVYVALIGQAGLYAASVVYIAYFMIRLGKYPWAKSGLVAFGVTAVAFLMFEVWFKVPLPKGPIEAALGLN